MNRRERRQLRNEERREKRYERKVRRGFLCVDCGKDTLGGEYYMVGNAIWAASGLGPNDGMLCLDCLTRRIGRTLRPEDFTAKRPSGEIWQAYVLSVLSACAARPYAMSPSERRRWL